jgi:hypothetical protein
VKSRQIWTLVNGTCVRRESEEVDNQAAPVTIKSMMVCQCCGD